MDRFAELLRFYRERCHDKERGKGKLTQARLSELIETQSGLIFTSQSISYWEQGKSQINKDDRSLLDALIKIFVEHGGMTSPTEANTFLLAGNYRPLSPNEMQKIFPVLQEPVKEVETPPAFSATASFRGYFVLFVSFLGELIFRPSQEAEKLWEDADENPKSWHTIFLRTFGRVFNGLGSKIPRLLPWLLPWWLTWRLSFRLMAWPFTDQTDALEKIILYIAGSLIVPALIAIFTKTQNDPFWQQQLTETRNLRLYTHQAAHIGFYLGYFLILLLALIGYYIGVQTIHPIFISIAALGPVLIGCAVAHQLPFDIWRAYGDLSLRRGGLFFIFVLSSFLLGGLFFFFYSYLLHPVFGPLGIMTALLLVSYTRRQEQHKPYVFIQFCVALLGIILVLSALLYSQWLLALSFASFCILIIFILEKNWIHILKSKI